MVVQNAMRFVLPFNVLFIVFSPRTEYYLIFSRPMIIYFLTPGMCNISFRRSKTFDTILI